MRKIIFSLLFCSASFAALAQQDLLAMLDSVAKPADHQRVFATFKTSKVINAQTTETVKKRALDFRITHRFGNMGTEGGGGPHSLYGWDNISDVRLSLDYGLTNDMTIGVARSKVEELLDFTYKWRFMTQTIDNHVPFSLCFYENMGLTPSVYSTLYAGTSENSNQFTDRLSYVSQLIFARKFSSRFSFELLPTFEHRNFVKGFINPNNNAEQQNDLIALGGAFRFKLTKRFAILMDYFHPFSKYMTNNSAIPYYDPMAVGVEIETGGHVFHINLTNAIAIDENTLLPGTTDSWSKGGFKLGFNISRVFPL